MTLLVDDATDSHEAAVSRIDGPVAHRRAEGGRIHVTLVDHHGEDESRRNLIALGGFQYGVRNLLTERWFPRGGAPAHAILDGADGVGQTVLTGQASLGLFRRCGRNTGRVAFCVRDHAGRKGRRESHRAGEDRNGAAGLVLTDSR
jgi:hypothetical protein